MHASRQLPLRIGFALLAALAVVLSIFFTPPSYAAERPFPDWDVTYERIPGTRAEGESASGDGCVRDPNGELTPLTTFAFHAMVNECEGVRTTLKFYYKDGFKPGEEPTLNFRFGATWQYRTADNPNELVLKPLENFLYDGKPVSPEEYDVNNPALRDAEGNLMYISGDKKGLYEPILHEWEAVFDEEDVHTFQFDMYLPADAQWGAMTWGTGSTGDTAGGSIGATANKLTVGFPAKVDFRYVLHSEYVKARGLQPEDMEKELDYGKGLPARLIAKSPDDVAEEKSTFELIQCLEDKDQQLAPMRDRLALNEIRYRKPYDDVAIPHSSETLFEDKAGTLGLAQWPYQFSVHQDGKWAPKKGLRPMNRSDGKFVPYLDDAGDMLALPYKPTVESLQRQIPGYEYVDNDITIEENGQFNLEQGEHSYKYDAAPNVVLRRVGPYDTQHFYFTYEPILGTFELEKTAVAFQGDESSDAPLANATFKLYEVLGDASAAPRAVCGQASTDEDVQVVEVCTRPEPKTAAELQHVLGQRGDCVEKRVRPVTLEGTDGTFTTDAQGKFTPEGDRQLAPGDYLLQEIDAPDNHIVLNEWTAFEVPKQTVCQQRRWDRQAAGEPLTEEDETCVDPAVEVKVNNYTPGTFELHKVGVDYRWDDADGTYVKEEVPLGGASFELYEPVRDSLAGDDIEEVSVCQVRTPASANELKKMLASKPTDCRTTQVRKVEIPGIAGAFTTDADGNFTPVGPPALAPGDYLLHEVGAPDDYHVLNEWIPFTISAATDTNQPEAVSIVANNYRAPQPPPTVPPTEPPTTPAQPEDPGKPGLPMTGTNPGWNIWTALMFTGAGLGVLGARKKWAA
ncbi:MAG: prealbumin-like fold domain-containing protein [Bowdeniella nasicola]|nr:prealbumin-like fold domain-containing protein [Bowdeniella nasicola]